MRAAIIYGSPLLSSDACHFCFRSMDAAATPIGIRTAKMGGGAPTLVHREEVYEPVEHFNIITEFHMVRDN